MLPLLAYLMTWVKAQTLGLRAVPARARAWGRRHPKGRLAGRVLAAAATVHLVAASAAYAAGGKKSSNPFLDAFGVADTHGNSVSKYDLSLGGGSGGLLPGKSDLIDPILQTFVVLGWEIYRILVTVALWFLDIALQYRVLDTLRPAANTVAQGLQTTVLAIGVVPIFLILSFIGMVYWMIQRRSGAGILDFFLSLVAAALLTSALANPVNWITGDDGLMAGSRDVGIASAVQITSGGQESSDDADALRKQTTGMLADKFIRIPHQLINYGAVIDDDGKCKKTYDKVIKEGPHKDKEDAKKELGKCNSAYEAAADDPGQALTGMIVLSPAGVIVVLLAGLLGLITLSFNLFAMYIGAKTVLDIARAILPTGAKASVLVNVTTLVVLAVASVLLLVIVGAFLVFVEALFAGREAAGMTLIETFVLLDILMLLGIVSLLVFWWKSLRSGKKLGDRMHRAIAPKPVNPSSNEGLRAVGMMGSRGAHLATAAAHRVNGAATAKALGAAAATPNVAAGGQTAGAPPAARKQALLTRIGKGAAKGSVKAIKIGAMSTVGAPVYAPRAAAATKAALSTKRTAVATSLQQAKQRAATKVRTKAADASAFGREYVHNLATAGRFVGKISGATHLAGWAVTAGVNPLAAGAMAAGTMFAGSGTGKPSNPTPVRGATRPGARPHGSATDFVLKRTTDTTSPTNSPRSSVAPATQPAQSLTKQPSEVPRIKITRQDLDRDELQAGRERLMAKMRERASHQRLPKAVGDER